MRAAFQTHIPTCGYCNSPLIAEQSGGPYGSIHYVSYTSHACYNLLCPGGFSYCSECDARLDYEDGQAQPCHCGA